MPNPSPSSFDEFYALRSAQLVRTIFMRTGDLERARDCVQEAFLRAWVRWDVLDSSDPCGWVTQVAWHLATKSWRRGLRERVLHGSQDVGGSVPSPPPEVIDLYRELQRLPAPQRESLVLFYLQDLSIRDVSLLLDMPEGTVKSHLARGRRALSARLQESRNG